MAEKIVLVKFINGEEILAELVYDLSDTFIRVRNPVRVVLVPSKVDPTQPSIGFAPWCEFSAAKDLEIYKTSVVYMTEPVQEFKNQYNTMFGGIVAPSTKLILPGA